MKTGNTWRTVVVAWLGLVACGGTSDLVDSSGIDAGRGGTAGSLTGGSAGKAPAPTGGGGTGGAACYSPFQNVSRAYDQTLPGCSCQTSSSICIQGVALICFNGQWQAVIDGPCWYAPNGRNCVGEVASAADCLALFQVCSELGTDRFCGEGRATNLCPNGVIVQTAGECYADASCYQLANGLWCTGGF
jgi:hypothetical protein